MIRKDWKEKRKRKKHSLKRGMKARKRETDG
jgi:hypothetical protein